MVAFQTATSSEPSSSAYTIQESPTLSHTISTTETLTNDRTPPATRGSRRSSRRSSHAPSTSSCDHPQKIRGWRHVVQAFQLAWENQRWSLFTAWIHVPLGITLLLVFVWIIKLGIDVAPFRFPAAVLAMACFFFILLALDWLSLRFPGRNQAKDDPEKTQEARPDDERRRFVEPIMKLLAPPCDFCLRNMSVMFTPSFILIPAREKMPNKEIGILTAFFIVTQILAFVLPVLLHWAVEWVKVQPTKLRRKRQEERISRSRRGSNATLAGMDFEKRMSYSGGQRLGSIATGLSGLTAVITAPISHISMNKGNTRYEDERLQITCVMIETARQQGDPAVATRAEIARMSGSPLADYHGFHPHHHPHQHHHHLARGRSVTLDEVPKRTHSAPRVRSVSPRILRRLGKTSPRAESNLLFEAERPQFPDRALTAPVNRISFGHLLPTAATERAAEAGASGMQTAVATAAPTPRSSLEIQVLKTEDENFTKVKLQESTEGLAGKRKSAVSFETQSRRPSRTDTQLTVNETDEADVSKKKDESARTSEDDDDDAASVAGSDCQQDAIERLSEWIADLTTPLVYLIVFIVGIPLFFIYNFALPLFMGINLLTFLASISIVPSKIRRYLHPIITTSFLTVMLIWAFGEMKGFSLSGVLAYYSNGAKYTVLWDLEGYKGPVPGAGDILFSTLDAGIVALAVPMYRYRRDLAENFTRMMVILTPCAALSLFVWPYLGKLFGMDSIRSLAFAARFMSTPLAIEMANNIGADESITVIIVVVTGIVAAILKEPFFKLMRVKMDDHICVGITMGSTAGAIGASSLISRPRVMAVASLAFVLFGTLLLICAAIPAIVQILRDLAGAGVL